MHFILSISLILLAAMTAHPAYAADLPPPELEGHCRNGYFPGYGPAFRIGRIRKGRAGSVQVLSDSDDCLKKGGADTRCDFHLLPRRFETVIAGTTIGDWSCIYYSNSADWARTSEFEFIDPPKNPPLKRWTGKWSDDSSSFTISLGKSKRSLAVRGTAQWMGGKDSENRDIVHTGEIDGAGSPSGNILFIGDKKDFRSDGSYPEGCAARFVLLFDILIVSDNSGCGGANVRFNGVFERR